MNDMILAEDKPLSSRFQRAVVLKRAGDDSSALIEYQTFIKAAEPAVEVLNPEPRLPKILVVLVVVVVVAFVDVDVDDEEADEKVENGDDATDDADVDDAFPFPTPTPPSSGLSKRICYFCGSTSI